MNFTQAKEYVEGLSRFGSVLGLDNIRELMKRLGNPQDELKVIHVAGTNGKGSTIAYLSQILTEAGYKVGKYTSPAVFEYLEKYQINNVNIENEDFAIVVSKVAKAVDDMISEGLGQPTIFEVETAIAYEYFRYKNCDIVIIETGMGGDTDATNVCSKVLVSVIVSISLDHTQLLGSTLTEIATHKAGIIKEGCPVVVYEQSKEVMETIKSYAARLHAPVVVAKTEEQGDIPFGYETSEGTVYVNLTPGLKGTWQIKNACVALEVTDVLRSQGFDITKYAVEAGIENTVWPGRFEQICDEPCIIIDGAHNPGAAKQLRDTLIKCYNDTKFVYIMGVLADKDFSEVIRLTADKAVKIITVTPNNERALAAEKLAKVISYVNKNVEVASSIDEAIYMAKHEYVKLEGKKAILAFGSLSYLGQLRKICAGMKEK